MPAERLRFHLDEHIDPKVAEALRTHGVDVTTTVEAGLRTSDDAAQLAFAVSQHRVIVTADSDFLAVAASVEAHPGIVFCHLQFRPLREIIRGLILVFEVLTPEEMVGHVEFI